MEAPINVIKNYFNYLNKNQWEGAVSWWDKDSRKDLLDFIADKENQMFKRGLLNIKEALQEKELKIFEFNIVKKCT